MYTNFTTQLQMVKSLVIFKLIYCLPLYTETIKSEQYKLHKIIMVSAQTIISSYFYKTSIKYIFGKYKMIDITQMISLASLKLFHKILLSGTPQSIMKLSISRRLKLLRHPTQGNCYYSHK